MPSQFCTASENQPARNIAMFAMISTLMAGVIQPGPNE
jgi:hypothetical protein